MLTVVGGTYLETCQEPNWRELFGSGLRAALALSGNIPNVRFHSCIGSDFIRTAEAICASYDVAATFQVIPQTVEFNYHHPLAQPVVYPDVFSLSKVALPEINADIILLYGMAEATVQVTADYVVYDPQNRAPFRNAGATARHLALVLNQTEALLLANMTPGTDLSEAGKSLLVSEGAEVVVIKNGAHGAWVIEPSGVQRIPLFKTPAVWSIGSGDVFSAIFAWKWAIEKLPAAESALWASRFTAHYCQRKGMPLPLPATPSTFEEASIQDAVRKVYLAGPFFTLAERWLINELRDKLLDFGNVVFSPLHDVGFGPAATVVAADLAGLNEADVVVAVATGLDPGTIFEVGYARALNKRVVVLAENVPESNLTMLIGSACEMTADFASAVYKASW